MKTVKIEGFVHEVTNYRGEVDYQLFPSDISEFATDKICIGRATVTFEIPDDSAMMEIKLKGLAAREKRIREEYASQLQQVDYERDKLKALTHQK